MNILLWGSQALLALHTLMGAIWKLSNSEQSVPSLKALPHGIWLTLGVLEVLLALALVLPALKKPLGVAAPVAALCIAAEMLLYCGLHLASGISDKGSVTYWLVVAAFCGFIAVGRLALKPIG